MEQTEQIKALIQKYGEAKKGCEDAAGSLKSLGMDADAHKYEQYSRIYTDVISDLKQLLTNK